MLLVTPKSFLMKMVILLKSKTPPNIRIDIRITILAFSDIQPRPIQYLRTKFLQKHLYSGRHRLF